jgi:ZIP family zinc transporter
MMDEPFLSSTFSSLEWQPLFLSCIAGASTCIGAAVVFLQPRQGNKRIVPPGMMAFSLALAGSVMLTVSVVSIIPECLQDDGSIVDDYAKGDVFQFIPFWSELMFYRVLFFVLGSILYFGLSRLLNIPEPQDLLLLHQGGFVGTSVNAATTTGGGGDGGGTSSSHSRSHLGQMFMPNDADNGHYGRLYRKGKVENDPEEDIATTTTATTANGQDRQIGIEADAQYYSFKTTSPHNNASPITSRLKKTKSREERIKTSSTENNNGKDKSRNKLSKWTKWTTGKDLQSTEQQKAWRVAILLFTSMLVHNFPEGLAVAASALESTNLGLTVTVGIMIHNIPEGIAIAIPCLAARPDQPWLGFVLASVSGLAEPMGAFVALMFLRGLERSSSSSGQKDVVDGLMMRGDIVMNLENVLAFVAGIMVTVALWELFPEAMRHSKEDKKKSHFWYGTLAGMVVMVLTELYVQ